MEKKFWCNPILLKNRANIQYEQYTWIYAATYWLNQVHAWTNHNRILLKTTIKWVVSVTRSKTWWKTFISCTTVSNTNQISQNGLLGLEEDEVLDFAKSTRSLKRTSSVFSCLVGVDEFRDKFWVCANKLSSAELNPELEWGTPCCSKNCCLWL